MSGQLLAGGDAMPHYHALPPIPALTRHYPRSDVDPTPVEHTTYLVNAVARCSGCGLVFVSRSDFNADYGPPVRWRRLRWWHRAAHRKLQARQTCDCRRARPVERDLTGHRPGCVNHPPPGWPKES